MQAINDTPSPAPVHVYAIAPGPTSGFLYSGVIYWKTAVNTNLNTQTGETQPDTAFGADMVDPKILTGVHYATPPV